MVFACWKLDGNPPKDQAYPMQRMALAKRSADVCLKIVAVIKKILEYKIIFREKSNLSSVVMELNHEIGKVEESIEVAEVKLCHGSN